MLNRKLRHNLLASKELPGQLIGKLNRKMSENSENFGKSLKRLRLERQITQRELSDLSGISETVLRELERGRSISPSRVTLQKLAAALGVSIDDVLRPVPANDQVDAGGVIRRVCHPRKPVDDSTLSADSEGGESTLPN